MWVIWLKPLSIKSLNHKWRMCELVYDQVKMPFPEKEIVLARPGSLTSLGARKVRWIGNWGWIFVITGTQPLLIWLIAFWFLNALSIQKGCDRELRLKMRAWSFIAIIGADSELNEPGTQMEILKIKSIKDVSFYIIKILVSKIWIYIHSYVIYIGER